MIKEPNSSAILEELHEDEEKLRRDERKAKIAFFLSLVLILVSLGGVSYLIFQSKAEKKPPATIINAVPSPLSEAPTASPSSSQITPAQVPVTSSGESKKSSPRDYYINIGSGSSQSLDYTDVSGALTTADINGYDNIKEVHFEAFINVPTANGKVSVRLFNKTDNYAVWNSEITRDGTKETYQFISPSLIYDRGPRLYQVQMKSQLNVLINLVSSRIRIITE